MIMTKLMYRRTLKMFKVLQRHYKMKRILADGEGIRETDREKFVLEEGFVIS